MTLREKKHLLDIKKKILVKNNLSWLYTKEKAEFAHDGGKLVITDNDLLEIVSEFQKYFKIRTDGRKRHRNFIR